jgi:hypothetical protein
MNDRLRKTHHQSEIQHRLIASNFLLCQMPHFDGRMQNTGDELLVMDYSLQSATWLTDEFVVSVQ